jgi:hypothetical protein
MRRWVYGNIMFVLLAPGEVNDDGSLWLGDDREYEESFGAHALHSRQYISGPGGVVEAEVYRVY